MATTRELEPLMAKIEQVLAALSTQPPPATLEAAVAELQATYDDYLQCCCRRAHVVPCDITPPPV